MWRPWRYLEGGPHWSMWTQGSREAKIMEADDKRIEEERKMVRRTARAIIADIDHMKDGGETPCSYLALLALCLLLAGCGGNTARDPMSMTTHAQATDERPPDAPGRW